MLKDQELTKAEFYKLLETIPEEEANSIIQFCRQLGTLPWDFFQTFGLEFMGIVDDDVPVYFACLYMADDETYRLWTFNRPDIKDMFSLFKISKRNLAKVTSKYSPIYTINTVDKKLIAKWNMRFGFLPYKVEDNYVFYKFERRG